MITALYVRVDCLPRGAPAGGHHKWKWGLWTLVAGTTSPCYDVTVPLSGICPPSPGSASRLLKPL